MDQKQLSKNADILCHNFELYRYYIREKNEKDLEQRFNDLVEEFGTDNINCRAAAWNLGVYRTTLRIEECSDMLSGKNSFNFKRIYPNIHNKKQYSLDDERVAKRLNLSKKTVRSEKLSIFREIAKILDI